MEDANLPVARRERRESSHSMRYGVETSAQNRPTSRARKLCRVPNCPHADLTDAPRYCIRHSICEVHIKAMEVMFNNKPYRFCQKCTRFHERHEFEADRHTCRERLQEQREKRMANMLARRSKLAAVDDRADNPQAHSAYPMLELPSIGYAVGSKRAAPQISDSLLMQLTFESQLPSSAGAGFGMTEFTSGGKLGMPSDMVMNTASELLAPSNAACRRRVDHAELGDAPSGNSPLAGNVPVADDTPRLIANMPSTPADVLRLVNLLQHQGQVVNGGVPLFSMEPAVNVAHFLHRSPEAPPNQSFAEPTPAPAVTLDFEPSKQNSANSIWSSSTFPWLQNAASFLQSPSRTSNQHHIPELTKLVADER